MIKEWTVKEFTLSFFSALSGHMSKTNYNCIELINIILIDHYCSKFMPKKTTWHWQVSRRHFMVHKLGLGQFVASLITYKIA